MITEREILTFAHSEFYPKIKELLENRKRNIERTTASVALSDVDAANLRGIYTGVDYLIYICERRLLDERSKLNKENAERKGLNKPKLERVLGNEPPSL